MSEEKLITVCSECLCASCWLGLFMCEKASSAGTVQRTRQQLVELDREHSRFWESEDVDEA